MNKVLMFLAIVISLLAISCQSKKTKTPNKVVETTKSKKELPEIIKIEGIAQNPEGIEYDKNDQSFLLSSLNAGPIIKIAHDGTYQPFTNGEPYPMSTAGLEIDDKHNRLLVAAFNGMELYDNNPATKGVSNLRIYNLKSGKMEKDINLSSLVPDAKAYFANDVAVDNEGNAYISDWYAGVVYKVEMNGTPSIFWKNNTGISGGANGLDFHPDGYLLVSLVSVNEKGLYVDYGLIKIPTHNSKLAKKVDIPNAGFRGFDGMVVTDNGHVVGVTNDGKTPGGNSFVSLSSKTNWDSAEVINSISIAASTTVAVTPDSENYIINQNFTNNDAENWTIKQIKL